MIGGSRQLNADDEIILKGIDLLREESISMKDPKGSGHFAIVLKPSSSDFDLRV